MMLTEIHKAAGVGANSKNYDSVTHEFWNKNVRVR
jgi:hypothetical protein